METFAQEFGFTADQAAAIAERGYDLLESGDVDGAVVIFAGLAVINPLDASMHAALGVAFQLQGRIEQASEEFQMATELDPMNALARVNRGELLLKRGDRAGLKDLEAIAGIDSALGSRARELIKSHQR